ncbi:MAG: DUF5908 family protein [Bacteroidota bacterium]
MAVEIKEIVIRAVLTEEEEGKTSDKRSGVGDSLSDRDTLVQECVRQVLKILNRKKRR